MSIQQSAVQIVSEVKSASFVSAPVVLQQKDFAIQSKWVDIAADLAGSVVLQASVNNETWSDIPNTSKTIASSGSEIWNMISQNYPYIRLNFTLTAGSGAFGAWITSKDAN
jgi:hypothetical protein